MAAALLGDGLGGTQYLDASGDPLNGGFIFTYDPGTTTKRTSYKDQALSSAHTNPIILDANGRPPSFAIWLNGETKMTVTSSTDTDDPPTSSLYTIDDINTDASAAGQFTVTSKSANYTIVAADVTKAIIVTATGVTLDTTDAITVLGDGFSFYAMNTSTGVTTFDPQGSETVQVGNDSAATTLDIPAGWGARIVADGSSAWYAFLFPLKDDVPGPNFAINGDFRVNQRQNAGYTATDSANNDDSYTLDRIILLSEGNDVVDVTQSTTKADIADGAYAGIALDVETEDLKAGILQILESRDTEALFKQGNGKCSLSFTAKTSDATNYTLIRAAVLAWDSTADSPTSDWVSSWGAEGTNPSPISNWTLENTPAALTALTTTPQRFKIENITLDQSGTTNLAWFIWMEDRTNDVTDVVTISDVKLEPGTRATPFVPRPYGEEMALCERYYEKSYAQATDPGAAATPGQHSYVAPQTSQLFNTVRFHVMKRAAPTVTLYSTVTGTSGQIRKVTATAADVAATASSIAEGSFGVTHSGAAIDQHQYNFQWASESEL